MDIKPSEDGVTHINVYSRGNTELGRLLSNFAHTPFSHPEFGEFASVEGFWYWLSLGKVYEELRPLYGFKCKQKGKELKTNGAKEVHIDDFEIQIKKALLLKVEQNQTVAKLLKESSLPLTHYYVYGNDLNDPGKYKIIHLNKFNWIVDYLSIVRLYLNGLAHKVIIAGSRDITDYSYLKDIFNKTDLEVVEFVSGVARGVDSLCIELAKEIKVPCALFPADWDLYKKAAGYIRNEQMAKYATALVSIWDGESPGTKNMIDLARKHNLVHKGFLY